MAFLAHLSRRLIGEVIVYEGFRRPSVRPSGLTKRHLLSILGIVSTASPIPTHPLSFLDL